MAASQVYIDGSSIIPTVTWGTSPQDVVPITGEYSYANVYSTVSMVSFECPKATEVGMGHGDASGGPRLCPRSCGAA